MTVKSRLRAEFFFHKLWTKCYQVKYFTTSQWPVPPIIYLIYRHVTLIYFLSWAVYSFFRAFGDMSSFVGSKLFIFLTVQSFFLLCIHLLVSAIIATYYYINNFPGCNCQPASEYAEFFHDLQCCEEDCHCMSSSEPVSFIYRLHWVLYNMSANSALLVTVGYWAVVWPYLAAAMGTSGVTLWDFTLHASNSIYFFIDLFVSATPICLFHWWMPVVYGGYYATFSILYWASGGKGLRDVDYIYPMIDYSDSPGIASATIILGLTLVIPLFQLLAWLYYRLRMSLYTCYIKRNSSAILHVKHNNREDGVIEMTRAQELL